MRRFLLFAGTFYYPEGGMNDLVGTFSSQQEAEQHFLSILTVEQCLIRKDKLWGAVFFTKEGGRSTAADWANVYDTKYQTVISHYAWRVDNQEYSWLTGKYNDD